MRASEIFSLAIRILGVYFLGVGLMSVPGYMGSFFHMLGHLASAVKDGSIISVPFLGLWPFAVAYWLLYGAPPLLHIAYPRDSQ
jgi:hypothetical protein